MSEARSRRAVDPNSSEGGARQRWGPFWLEEPSWYWLLAGLVTAVGVAAFALLLVFDHP